MKERWEIKDRIWNMEFGSWELEYGNSHQPIINQLNIQPRCYQ